MIEETKRIEYWNFLTAEKNQARPKGITVQRLSVVKPQFLKLDEVWSEVIDRYDAGDQSAALFYTSGEAAVRSRAAFWNAVRSFIAREGSKNSSSDIVRARW
jgi:hypothetical protein